MLRSQVEECHLPGLGVALTLDYKPDSGDEAVSLLVSFVSGLLLGTNSKVRTWFSMFIRNGQQVTACRCVCLHAHTHTHTHTLTHTQESTHTHTHTHTHKHTRTMRQIRYRFLINSVE